MKAQILKGGDSPEFYIDEGCYVTEITNRVGDPDLSVARIRVAPGDKTRLHYLVATTERYLVEHGSGVAYIGDLPPQRVARGDQVLIPPGCVQCIYNDTEADLVFLALCTPRFLQENYVDAEPE